MRPGSHRPTQQRSALRCFRCLRTPPPPCPYPPHAQRFCGTLRRERKLKNSPDDVAVREMECVSGDQISPFLNST